jgi:hypothetical protein
MDKENKIVPTIFIPDIHIMGFVGHYDDPIILDIHIMGFIGHYNDPNLQLG